MTPAAAVAVTVTRLTLCLNAARYSVVVAANVGRSVIAAPLLSSNARALSAASLGLGLHGQGKECGDGQE